jgi:restriction system protein
MARRKQGVLLDLVEVATRWPWWVGLVLAVLAYIGFHALAGISIPPPKTINDFGGSTVRQMFKVGGMLLQVLVPLALVLGALVSAIKQKRRGTLLRGVQSRTESAALFDMNWREFEQLTSEYFRRRGFSVADTGGGGADGGRDLVLRKGADKYLVQCKQWRASKVGVEIVRELLGVMTADGAVGGFVVSSGEFTSEARRFADGRNIELINGGTLKALIGKLPSVRQAPPAITPQPASSALTCQACGKPMVRRTAKKGSRTGEEFWGCTGFPACKSTRPLLSQ